ncbi:hypothetical protein CL621_01735 [archaeon]|nr:hypothetical protein [archaeon]
MNQEEIEEEEKKRSPIVYILVVFIILIIVLMAVPFYGIKANPSPKYTPTLKEILPANKIVGGRLYQIEDIKKIQVSAFIRNSALKIATLSCKKESEICYSKAFYYFVRDLNYVSDPERQYVQAPEETLIGGGGDCEDLTILLAQLLKAINIKTRIVLTYDHAFLQVYLPKALSLYKVDEDWISLDPTSNYDFGKINPKYYQEVQKYIYV